MANGRREWVRSAAALGAAAVAGRASAQGETHAPPAGPIRAGRASVLDGKVAVVTGAARGIGRAIAVELAANGADVVAVDICGPVSSASDAEPATAAELDETVAAVKGFGRRAQSVRADIRDIGALREVAAATVRDFGKVDIVVANAAIQRWMRLLDMEDSDWRDVIDNNLNGTANTIRAFAPAMVARRYGRIIVVSSMQGKHGTNGASSYSASKWGILGLMKSAAMELGRDGITVNAILPGLVKTPLTTYEKRYQHLIAEHRGTLPEHATAEEAWAVRAPTMPLKVGWLQPEDISPVAVFLASDAAAMVTGADYEVTAGDSALDP